jgi:hypothetical protein
MRTEPLAQSAKPSEEMRTASKRRVSAFTINAKVEAEAEDELALLSAAGVDSFWRDWRWDSSAAPLPTLHKTVWE